MRPLLFDLDGVIIDSRASITRCLNHALARAGFAEQPPESLLGYIGPPLVLAFRDLLKRLDGDPARAEECVALYRERYRRTCVEETTLMPGIEAAVRDLARRHTLMVATSKARAFAEPILAGLGLEACFRAVVGPGLDPQGESKTETVGRALSGLGPDKGGAVMIGDRLHDVEGGKAHRLVTVGVTWGFGSEAELREAGADHLVATPDELVALAAKL